MSLRIEEVINASSPINERVRIKATQKCSTKGYAIVDRTFAEDGEVSNEFRHIYILPDVTLERGERIIIRSGVGEDGWYEYGNSKENYYRAHWGSESCIWNDNGKDKATLIKFEVIHSKTVPATK